MSAIDLTRVPLAGRGPVWLHAAPPASHRGPVDGSPALSRERLQRIAEGVNRGVRGASPVVEWDDGRAPAGGGTAAGRIERAEVRGDCLWIAVAFTDRARSEVRRGAWRYLTPELGDWTDPRSGQRHADVLLGAALTRRPFVRGPTDQAAVTRFMAGIGRRLGATTFEEALAAASREDPPGYAAWCRRVHGGAGGVGL